MQKNAAMPIGEFFVSAFLSALFKKLVSPELLQFIRQEGLDSKVKELGDTLKMIEAVLGDAEEKQLTNRAVKMWLDDLRDLAYDVEDILDEFATEASTRKLKMKQHQVRKFIPTPLSKWSLDAINYRKHMKSEIKNIHSRLEGLCKLRKDLGLNEFAAGASSTAPFAQRLIGSSVQTEPVVHGRDVDKTKLLEMVLRDEPDANDNIGVISIVAMGGAGKTTLAREVYNDEAVKDFEPKAWVCVSHDFDVLRISKAILESFTSSPSNLTNLDEVQVRLKDIVAGKKILLVLDDVWTKDYGCWQKLKSPFKTGAPGSKIIVTTRLEDVALTMGRVTERYQLRLLSDDDCWSVFKQHALDSKVVEEHQISESTHKKVVEKCKGLPLAARTLGGLLRCKESMNEWEDVLNNKIWNLSDENGVLPVLRLSYYHLPSHLKRCFAYCSILPQDYEFEEKEIVLLWMAEGFMQQTYDDKPLEDLGSEYFHEFLKRSIFQGSNRVRTKFIMHDLVNDLAKSISGKTSFRLESLLKNNKQSKELERSRYSSYISDYYDNKEKFEIFHKGELLRTFLAVDIKAKHAAYEASCNFITRYFFSNLLPKFKKLRVLSLKNYYVIELPDSIKYLRQLRYLDLSSTWIRGLPESTTSLFNLQTLLLRDCICLMKLPCNIRNLVNLRHLDIRGVRLKEMPLGMRDLKHLRTLSNFIVGKSVGSSLKDLAYLKFLDGELHISQLENVTDAQDMRETILGDKENIKVLQLEWGSQFDDSPNEEVQENVFDMLRPTKYVKELSIKCYAGRRLSSWIGDPSFSHMKVLRLENCRNCTYLPSLELLTSLKDLTFKAMSNIKRVDSESFGESLEILRFEDLEEWECWDPAEENEQHVQKFHCLRKLWIVKCPKLSGRLPNPLASLRKLVVRECEQLTVSISSLTLLRELELDRCKDLTCTSPTNFESLKNMVVSNISMIGNRLRQGFGRVKDLKIVGSDEVRYLWQNEICPEQSPRGFHSLTSLSQLHIEGCNSLTYIVMGHLPPSLRRLKIENCKELQYLVNDRDDTCSSSTADTFLLKYLCISNCPSLTCILSEDQFPASLKHLEIKHCGELTTLSPSDQLSKALESLKIYHCPKLESIAKRLHMMLLLQGELPKTQLNFLSVHDCEKLEALPDNLHNINSLQLLRILGCPSATSFGFPTNLTSLFIEVPDTYQPLFEWGLHRLTSLRELRIIGCRELESFPQEDEGMMLPPSQTYLHIERFPNLKFLFPHGFGNLASLEKLSIKYCPKLTSFPDAGLPSSLLRLNIKECPQLGKQCRQKNGREWSKIAHIPCLFINEKYLYRQGRVVSIS